MQRLEWTTAADAPSPRWVGGRAGACLEPVRLFCFAHAGGGAAAYRPWQRALAGAIDVRPVVLPGREGRVRERPFRRVEHLLGPMCDALAPYLDRSYALFGHSMGAVVAFEATRRLVRDGFPPACLVVSGRGGPRSGTRRAYSSLSDETFLAELARLDGTPVEVLAQPELLRAMLPALRADFELNEAYRPLPAPPLSCPVAAYMGMSDTEVDPPSLLEWAAETSGEFTLRTFPGGHFYLKSFPGSITAALRDDIGRAMAAPVPEVGPEAWRATTPPARAPRP